MNYTTLGIIGHVDHGKTTLVKALTGIETDRLKEEKERGISISLGYAHLETPAGELGIIDAPGHERFIRTMISGATGMQAVLLVIDVNEGVKPQTIEHLDIASLLGVKMGVVAVTKCDTADDELRELVRAELADLLEGTFLEDAPVVDTSSESGEGLDELKQTLANILAECAPLPEEGSCYLPIDRVFTIDGFGTVVTGTLRRGSIAVGDEMEVFPKGILATVRELQSHNAFTETALPGHRSAVNLRATEKTQLGRGDAIATPGSIRMASIVDAQLHLLENAKAPLKNRQGVRLLFGTTEVFARAHLIEADEVIPGETCVLQFRLEEAVAAPIDEAFIIRTYSPSTTIGGGKLLGGREKGTRRRDTVAIERLRVYAEGSVEEKLAALLEESGLEGVLVAKASQFSRQPIEPTREILDGLGVEWVAESRAVQAQAFTQLSDDVLKQLDDFHASNPTLQGLTKDQFNDILPRLLDTDLLDHLVERLSERKAVDIEKGVVRRAGFNPGDALNVDERRLADEIETAFKKDALTPPRVDEVVGKDKDRQRLYRYLLDSKVLRAATVPTRNKSAPAYVAFHADSMAEALKALESSYGEDGQFTTAQAKEILGISRKYLIPLLESFDAMGITRRNGEHRVFVGR